MKHFMPFFDISFECTFMKGNKNPFSYLLIEYKILFYLCSFRDNTIAVSFALSYVLVNKIGTKTDIKPNTCTFNVLSEILATPI